MYKIRSRTESSDTPCDCPYVEFIDSVLAPGHGAWTTPTHGDLTESSDDLRSPLMPPADGLVLLTEKQRMVLRAKIEGRQTFEFIGRGIGVSRQAAHRIHHRALAKLAKAGRWPMDQAEAATVRPKVAHSS